MSKRMSAYHHHLEDSPYGTTPVGTIQKQMGDKVNAGGEWRHRRTNRLCSQQERGIMGRIVRVNSSQCEWCSGDNSAPESTVLSEWLRGNLSCKALSGEQAEEG